MQSLDGAILGRSHPLEMSQPVPPPGSVVPVLPQRIPASPARRRHALERWCPAGRQHHFLPPWISGEAGECGKDLGGLQRCCFGAESGDFLGAPRRAAAVPKAHRGLGGLCLSRAEVEGFPGDSQVAASTSPGQWEQHRRGTKLTVMGGAKTPHFGAKGSGAVPWCPRRLEGHPGAGGRREGTRTRHSLVSPRGRPGRGVAGAGVYRRWWRRWSLNILVLAGLAPAVAAVGRDAQQEVGGHRGDGDDEADEGDEEIVVEGQREVAGLEALLGQ